MLKGTKLLVVDDDCMSLEMLTTMLSGQGVLCTAAVNGRAAMDMLESSPDFDLMLLDLQMPVMNGFEVIEQCKGNPFLNDIPIIVMATDRQERLRSLKLGAEDFLAKPYDLEELELRITRLVQSRRQIQAAKQAKHDFLAVASHELRTPMNQIIGLADLLSDANLDGDQREYVNLLKLSTVSLTDIIRNILNFVQLDHSSTRSAVEPFSLQATLQKVLETYTAAADNKGLTLTLNCPNDISDTLTGPSFYIYKVTGILLDNAIKFSTTGQISINITEENLDGHSSRFCCSICDQGIGIPAEFHEKVFEPFVQVDSSSTRKYEGIGLGLAIAKRMVELMGGTIYIAHSSHEGSSFNFSFQCDV